MNKDLTFNPSPVQDLLGISCRPFEPRFYKKLDSEEFKQILTAGVVSLGNLFHKNGFELRIVGGAVRDLMLGKLPKDTDLASDATPDEMVEMFEKGNIKYIPTGLQHGTITAVINDEQLEITTLRADTEHTCLLYTSDAADE